MRGGMVDVDVEVVWCKVVVMWGCVGRGFFGGGGWGVGLVAWEGCVRGVCW